MQKKEDKRKVKFYLEKEFDKHYYLDEHDKFKVTLYCDYDEIGSVYLNTTNDYRDHLEAHYKDVYGKDCYVGEYYRDNEGRYKLHKVNFDFDPWNSADGYNESEDGETAKSKEYHVSTYDAVVKVVLTNYLKEEKKITEVDITKVVVFPYATDKYAVEDFLDDASFRIALVCKGEIEVDVRFTDAADFELAVNSYGINGKANASREIEHKDLEDCRVTEIENPQDIEGKVTIDVTIDGVSVASTGELTNDAVTQRFDTGLFDVPAGLKVDIKVTDKITNHPKAEHPPQHPAS